MANQGDWAANQVATADKLNSSLLQYDVIASRPAAGQIGRMFYATDESLLYRDNGTTWDLIHPGLKLEGINETEVTTTSTTIVDLISLTGLSIAVGDPVLIIVNTRKTTGAADNARIGFKINSTNVRALVSMYAATNANESVMVMFMIGARNASYLRSGQLMAATEGAADIQEFSSDMPNAVITSVTIQGAVDNALITLATDNLKVYSFKGS